jgi:hypothetical protein
MKKKNVLFLTLTMIAFTSFVFLASCKKDSTNPPTPASANCDVRGSYSGTYTNQLSQSASFAYILMDDNFIKGSGNLSSPPTAFGSYSNTCDSITLRS